MSQALPSIGAHCSVESCNVNDFLPIRCKCEKLFCRDHIFPEYHECPVNQPSVTVSAATGTQVKLLRCDAELCNKPSLEAYVADSADSTDRTPAVCPDCRKAFCAIHRDATAHSCSREYKATLEPKEQAAHELLAMTFSTAQSAGLDRSKTVTTRPVKPPRSAKKAAQLRQVELMRMRHHAQPGDPRDRSKDVPLNERLHIIVKYGDSTQTLWFKKNIGTGKALDLLTASFKVTSSVASTLHLSKVSLADGERIQLMTDVPIAELVEDGTHLVLSR